jgi:hypothetical protein
MKDIEVFPTITTRIKKNSYNTRGNSTSDDFGGGRTLGVLRRRQFFSPATRILLKYLHMTMTCNFVIDTIEYILCKQFNDPREDISQ